MAALAAIAVLAWVLWHRPPPRRAPTPMAATFHRARLALLSSIGADPQVPSSVGPGASATASATAVCGMPVGLPVEEASTDADETPAAKPISGDASAAVDAAASTATTAPAELPPPSPAEQRILDAMARSSDLYERAAVLVIGPSGMSDDPATRLERLAAMARDTADPRVYALAYRACDGLAATLRPAACAALTTAQWARLDAGNGVPWLYALGDIPPADAAARDDALFHLAAAERVDDRYAEPSAAVANHMAAGDDDAAFAAWSLAGRAVYATSPPPLPSLLAQCSKAQLADANRRQLCAAVADKLIDHSSSLILAAIGASVDRLVTGSPERADRLRAERDALLADNKAMTDFSCSGLRRTVRRIQRSAQIGELAALREAVTVSAER